MKVEDDYIKDKELQDGLSKSKANGMNWWDGKEEYSRFIRANLPPK